MTTQNKQHSIFPHPDLGPRVNKKLHLPQKPFGYNIADMPLYKADQDALGKELVFWAESSNDAFDIDDFPLSKRISPYRFKNLKGNPFFDECLEIAKKLIASRMKRSARQQKLSESYLRMMLPMHDKEFHEHLKELRESSTDNKQNAAIIEVHYDSIPSSNLVPERNEHRNQDEIRSIQAAPVSDTNS